MESNIRNKFLHLQKGVKRQRILLDETTELVEQNEPNNNNETVVVVDENNHPVEAENANEPELVEFERGMTNKGGICHWHAGFRYLKKEGDRLKCSNSDCQATAKIKTNQDEPARKLAEEQHSRLSDTHTPTLGNRNTPDRSPEDTLDEGNNEEEDEGGEVNSSEENEYFPDDDDPWAASDCGQNPSASSDIH